MNLPRNTLTSPAPCRLFATAALLALLAGCNHDNSTPKTTSSAATTDSGSDTRSSASTMNTGSGASGPTTANDTTPPASANVGASSASGSDPRYFGSQTGSTDTSATGTSVTTGGSSTGTYGSTTGTSPSGSGSSASGSYGSGISPTGTSGSGTYDSTTPGTASGSGTYAATTSSGGANSSISGSATSSDVNGGSSRYMSDSEKSGHTGHSFWRKARIASRREMAYSELAATKASDPQVRSFAQQLVDEHRRMQAEFASRHDSDDTSDVANASTVSSTREGNSSMAATTSATGGTGGGVNGASGASESGITSGGDNSKEVHPIANGGPDNGRYPADGSGREAYGPNSNNAMGGSPSTSGERNTPTSMNSDDQMADNRDWDRDGWMKNDRDYAQLSGKSGAEFDKAYLALVINAEKDAVAACEKKAKMKDDSDSTGQRYANDLLAKHRERLEQARALQNTLG